MAGSISPAAPPSSPAPRAVSAWRSPRPSLQRGRERRPHRPVPGGRRTPPRPRSAAQRSASLRTRSTKQAARRCVDVHARALRQPRHPRQQRGHQPGLRAGLDQDHGRFAKTFDVNLWAPVLWTRLATRAWMGEHGGAVVNTASVGGMTIEPNIGSVQRIQGRTDPSHQATGAGTLAEGPGQRGGAGCGAHQAGRGAVEGPASSAVSDVTALGRIGEPADIAVAVAFLVSDARELDHRRDDGDRRRPAAADRAGRSGAPA